MRAPSLLIAAALLTACPNRVVTYQVNVVDTGCANQPQPLQGAGFLRFVITGDGIATPIVDYYPVGQHAASIPQIPAGTNRVIEVRAYDNDPRLGSAKVLSLGRSLPFTVPTVVPSPSTVSVTLFLRPVGIFTQPNLASDPGTCSQMLTARAGHSATLLADGRVFVAGGFEFDGGNTAGLEPFALEEAEFYDPTTGAFTAAPPIEIQASGQTNALPRAYQAATLESNGQVILVGGEEYRTSGGVTSTIPVKDAIVFDPDPRYLDYGGLSLVEPRSRAGIGVDDGGRILIAGGITTGGGTADLVEWLDPATWEISLGSQAIPADCSTGEALPGDAGCGLSFPRLGAAVSAVSSNGEQYVAVAGGTTDGGNLQPSVTFFQYQGGAFQQLTQTLPLLVGRTEAGVAPFQDPTQLIVAGGYGQGSGSGLTLLGDTNVIKVGSFEVDQGPAVSARANICAALLQDGRVLTISGLGTSPLGASQTDPSVELITADGGPAQAIPQTGLNPSRYAHSCTTLMDGSVFVVGGVNLTAQGQQTVLQDAWIYMPAPLN